MNAAAAETGGRQVPVAPLPEHADAQAFAPVPRESFMDAQRWTNHYLHESTDGLVPDLFQDQHTATHWSEASPAERAQLIADAAGLVPLPGMKVGVEGLEHLAGPAAEALVHGAPPVVTHGLTHDAVPVAPHAPVDAPAAPRGSVDVTSAADHGLIENGGDSAPRPVEHHATDAPVEHHSNGDAGHAAPYGFEDTSALLSGSESAGGHLLDRHVGQTVEDLSTRLDAGPRPGAVSTFSTAAEATTAVSAALQHNQAAVDAWVANGATDRLRISVPFEAGEVLVRGSTTTVPGTSVLVVLEGIGGGKWIVLTGYPTP